MKAKQNRYRVELSLNIWCENDEEAKAIAEKICAEQRKSFDNRCQINKLARTFGGFIDEKNIV